MVLNGTGRDVTGLSLTLTDVNLFTTGLYGCEASADGSFHTELVRKYMTVLGKKWQFLSFTFSYVSHTKSGQTYAFVSVVSLIQTVSVLKMWNSSEIT